LRITNEKYEPISLKGFSFKGFNMEKEELFLNSILGHVVRTERDTTTGKLLVILDDYEQTIKDIKEILGGNDE